MPTTFTGNLVHTFPDKKEIRLWTPDGEKNFDVQTGRSKLGSFEEAAQYQADEKGVPERRPA